ncbi:MAG: hypothetical protein JOZ41_08745, partial [Chloroflexi bacterium]|nr:hypothetical protein [Chloroflexota bacterium]
MKLKHRLLEQLEDTPLADTHEHLLDESTRLAREHPFLRSGDWSVLLGHYVCDDLTVARASVEADLGFFDRHDAPKEKFALVADHWAKARNTGYGQALRRTLRGL